MQENVENDNNVENAENLHKETSIKPTTTLTERETETTILTTFANETANNNFNVNILKETVTSITIDWNLITYADVYEIEKYHKRHGWENVVWISAGPAMIEDLMENFAYRLRVKALKYSEEHEQYVAFQTSAELVATTKAALPTNISLYRAIKKGQQFLVKRILRRRPSLIEYPGPNDYLPLTNAIAFGEISIIDVLLTAGASVHVGNQRNRRTALHLAFHHGLLVIARVLLNKKANMEAVDANGMTPCHFAVDANQFEILKFALENGANVEANDACGWTLLLRAVVMRAELSILKLLLMHGANTKALDKLGQNCVDLARLYGNTEATKYFANSVKVNT